MSSRDEWRCHVFMQLIDNILTEAVLEGDGWVLPTTLNKFTFKLLPLELHIFSTAQTIA